ncbi:MAG: filament integrity protein fraC [Nostocaceae cyanobacterium]|nr:filament integrity protein fraC [Nostocaceae cyanobacterium]
MFDITLPNIFPDITLPTIFPIGAILLHFLFLLVAIPIEAYILNLRLKFDKKTSSFYAITTNIFSAALGWIIFFASEPLLPWALKSKLISYVFFNRFQWQDMQTLLIITAFIIFFGTFIMKYLILQILVLLLRQPSKKTEEVPLAQRRSIRNTPKAGLQSTSLVTSILIGNSLSYSAITFVLLFRSSLSQ